MSSVMSVNKHQRSLRSSRQVGGAGAGGGATLITVQNQRYGLIVGERDELYGENMSCLSF